MSTLLGLSDPFGEAHRIAERGPGRDREHDRKERMLFQKDRVGEIVAISEMEADEEVGL
jgi:hypothetical protein